MNREEADQEARPFLSRLIPLSEKQDKSFPLARSPYTLSPFAPMEDNIVEGSTINM